MGHKQYSTTIDNACENCGSAKSKCNLIAKRQKEIGYLNGHYN